MQALVLLITADLYVRLSVARWYFIKPITTGVQKVLQLDHKEEWKCYKLQFIFIKYNPY